MLLLLRTDGVCGHLGDSRGLRGKELRVCSQLRQQAALTRTAIPAAATSCSLKTSLEFAGKKKRMKKGLKKKNKSQKQMQKLITKKMSSSGIQEVGVRH